MNIIAENLKIHTSSTFINTRSIPEIESVEQELTNCLSNLSTPMKEMCIHILNSGGKRLRPLLLFYSGKCFGSFTPQMLKAATAAELIHLASLVHDDIIDNSDLRHNRITLNSKHGNHISVLIGDFLFAKAFEILCCNQIFEGMKYFVEAIEEMCEGEILQASEIESPTLSFDHYFVRIEKKTAKLISACCKTGAAIGSSNHTYIESMGKYGLNLGYAFQIIDDILDINGDNKNLGKPVFNDLIQGNLTLPILILNQYSEYTQYINEIVERKTVSKEIQSIIAEGLHGTGSLNQAYHKAIEYCEAAKENLKDIPDSPHRKFLMSLPETVLARCN